MSASGLSAATKLPEPTVSKVLKLLAKANIVASVRGVNGGYKLAHKTKDINVAQIVMSIEGPVTLASCVDTDHDNCSYATACPVKGRWNPVNDAVKAALVSVSLEDMIREDYTFPTFEKTELQGTIQ